MKKSLSLNQFKADLIQPLLDLLEDGVIVHDENRCISLANSAMEKITGQSRVDIIGRDCHEVFSPDGICGAGCAFQQGYFPSTEIQKEQTVPFARADGREIYIKIRSHPIVIKEKNRGVLIVVRDVTEVSDLRWKLNRKQNFHGMVGSSRKISEVFELIRVVGASEYSVLILGESGTGKELAAYAVHRESRRRSGPFVPVNCGALPDSILESELFGHVRGAFTGAIRDRKGRFELADGGTIFLDEIGELTMSMQVKLLRVLQERTFVRVGGEKQIKVNIRVIAATNNDLKQMIADGEFREDLYYRLCVVPVELPPLRKRRDDIQGLISYILESIRKETGKEISGVTNKAMQLLMGYSWPGNIRELINALQFASVHCSGELITDQHLPHEIRFEEENNDTGGRHSKLTLDAVDTALNQAGGNKVKAAKILGVGRATLYRFLSRNK